MSDSESNRNGDDLPFSKGRKKPRQESDSHGVAPELRPNEADGVTGIHAAVSTPPRKLPRRKLYQDEIYGSKEISPLAVALIDTPEFQRLGHIYQLGLTHTVFRGGNHRRLDHCVGTYLMSRTLLRRIVQNHARLHSVDSDAFAHPGRWLSSRLYLDAPGTPSEDQRRYSPMGRWRGLTEVVSAAALLHDLGHVAVGHTLEDEFSVFDKHDGLGGPRLFEFLYGPRQHKLVPTEEARRVDCFFEPIDAAQLSRPHQHDLRTPLPWTFEEGVYERFLPEGRPTPLDPDPLPGLTNSELRDLLYLILSFKETIDDNKFTEFDGELDEAKLKAAEQGNEAWKARLHFIHALYKEFSTPIQLGAAHDFNPLFHPFMSDIVGNTICADFLDYLVRDGQRLRLDIRNNPRLQRYLVVRPESSFVKSRGGSGSATSRELRLTINAVYRNGLARRDTVSDLLDLMRERYRFAEVVYYHPKKCAFSTMFAKALELAPYRPRDGVGIYPAPWSESTGSPEREPHIVHFGDDTLLAYLANPTLTQPDPQVEAMVRRITYRDEYRLLFTLDYEAANEAGGSPRKIIDHLRPGKGGKDEGRKEWEQIFARMLEGTELSDLVDDKLPPILIYCPNLRMQAKEVAARVELMPDRVIPLNQQHEDQTLRDEIITLNEKYRQLWRLYLFVHPRLAPVGNDRKDEKVTFLSAVVDAFCERYGVTAASRVRGFRFADYRPLRDRVEDHLTGSRALGRVNSAPQVRKRVRKIARDVSLWSAALRRPEAPFPVNLQEYETGVAQAVVLVAAENATARQRAEWSEPLRDFEASDWYRNARTANGEIARSSGYEALAAVAVALSDPSLDVSQRDPVESWDELVQRVSNTLKRATVKSS